MSDMILISYHFNSDNTGIWDFFTEGNFQNDLIANLKLTYHKARVFEYNKNKN